MAFLTDIQTTALADKPDLLHLNKGGVDYAISVEDLQRGLTNEGVSTVADLATRESKAGEFVYTLGYHSAYDGGHGLYKIVPLNDLNGTLDNIIHHTTTNNLVAELVTNGTINPRQAGASATAGTDDAPAFTAIKNQYKNKIKVVPALESDIYRLRTSVLLTNPISLNSIKLRRDVDTLSTMFKVSTTGCEFLNCDFDNANIKSTVSGTGTATTNIWLQGPNTGDTRIIGCQFYNFGGAFNASKGDDAILIDQYTHNFTSDNKGNILIEKCTIRSPWRNGIAITNGENITIRDNYIYNTAQAGILVETYASVGNSFYVKNIEIVGNMLVDCGVSTPQVGGANYISSQGQYGIGIISVKPEYDGTDRYYDITVRNNNIIIDADNLQDTSGGLRVCYPLIASSCRGVVVEGNTIDVKNRTSSSPETRVFFASESSNTRGDNYRVNNNYFNCSVFKTYNAEKSIFSNNHFYQIDEIVFGTNNRSVVKDNYFDECPVTIPVNMLNGEFSGNRVVYSQAANFPACLVNTAGQNIRLVFKGNRIIGDFTEGLCLDTNSSGQKNNIALVEDNYIDGCYWGIFVQYYTNAIVRGNTIVSCGRKVFDTDHDKGDGGGGVYANFSNGIKVINNSFLACHGTPCFIRKCDDTFMVKGNDFTGSATRPYTIELNVPKYTSAIYIYRDGPAGNIGWVTDNNYDQSSDVSPFVIVENSADGADGSFTTGMIAFQGTEYNNTYRKKVSETSIPRYHPLGTGETGGADTADGHVKIEVDGTTYNVLTSSTAV